MPRYTWHDFCEHRVALVWALIDACTKQSRYKIDIIFITSDEIEGYLETSQTQFKEKSIAPSDSTIRLYPCIKIDNHRQVNSICQLGLKISCGNSKPYVVKDIESLLSNIEYNSKSSYGKNLEISHSYESLNDISKKIYKLIDDHVNSYYYFNKEFIEYNKRFIGVPGIIIRDILEICKNSEVIINGKTYKYKAEMPEITMNITKIDNNSIKIEYRTLHRLFYSKDAWMFKDTHYYYCNKNFTKDVLNFFSFTKGFCYPLANKAYDLNSINTFILNKDDYESFCGNVLKKLQKYINIVYNDIDLSSYMPKEPEFSFYFESEDDSILLTSYVFYGEKNIICMKIMINIMISKKKQ